MEVGVTLDGKRREAARKKCWCVALEPFFIRLTAPLWLAAGTYATPGPGLRLNGDTPHTPTRPTYRLYARPTQGLHGSHSSDTPYSPLNMLHSNRTHTLYCIYKHHSFSIPYTRVTLSHYTRALNFQYTLRTCHYHTIHEPFTNNIPYARATHTLYRSPTLPAYPMYVQLMHYIRALH